MTDPSMVAPLVATRKACSVDAPVDSTYRDNRGLSHGFVLDDESLDLTRINVDPSDNLGVVGAAAVGNPPVAVDTHPVPRVEPTLIRDGESGRFQ